MNSPELQPDPNEPSPAQTPQNEGLSSAAAELVEDIDQYQKRIEQEWESARAAYQARLAGIMDDVLNKGASARLAGAPTAPAGAVPERLALPAPIAKPKYGTKAAFAALTAAVIVSALFAFRMPAFTPLPYQRTGAVVMHGGRLPVADWFRKTMYVHAVKRGAPIVSVEALPVGLVAGLAADTEGLWTIDALAGEILRHAPTSDHAVLARHPAPDEKPAGLFEDGDSLWVAGLATRKLYRLRNDDPAEIRDSFDLPLENVTALQVLGKRVWALDGKARELTLLRLQKPLKPLATYDLDPFLNGATPTGLAIVGKTAWIVTENPAAIVRLPLSRLKKGSDSDL